jgi:hypothetical protein
MKNEKKTPALTAKQLETSKRIRIRTSVRAGRKQHGG